MDANPKRSLPAGSGNQRTQKPRPKLSPDPPARPPRSINTTAPSRHLEAVQGMQEPPGTPCTGLAVTSGVHPPGINRGDCQAEPRGVGLTSQIRTTCAAFPNRNSVCQRRRPGGAARVRICLAPGRPKPSLSTCGKFSGVITASIYCRPGVAAREYWSASQRCVAASARQGRQLRSMASTGPSKPDVVIVRLTARSRAGKASGSPSRRAM